MHVSASFQPLLRVIGLDADAVFDDPRIRVWRKLDDRENCTLDGEDADGNPVRLHIKRYTAVTRGRTPAEIEQAGQSLLEAQRIPTASLVAWGVMPDRRSFTVWLDLADFTPGDKMIAGGFAFDRLLEQTADLAAKLHRSGLHHRDLYLCHFMVHPTDPESSPEVRLIDVARVRRLPGFLTRRRWIVKDLAQFWYSTTKHGEAISDEQRDRWLARYCQSRRDVSPGSLRSAILRKVRAIARHDARLNRIQPNRNVSLPGSGVDANNAQG
jgi:hypothetical protein